MKNKLNQILTIKPWILFLSVMLFAILAETKIGILYMIIWCGLFTYWTLRVGEELHKRLEDKSILDSKRFKYQIVFVVIYFIITFLFGGYEITNENISDYGWTAWVIIPLHLILMYLIFHTIYFLSKCITTLRDKHEVPLWYMMGFWVFPIGIWIIQPRIIELLNEKPANNKEQS